MEIKLLAWAQAKRELGFSEHVVVCSESDSPADIIKQFPKGSALIQTCRVALDESFCDWSAPVGNAKEMAIIPPVSGG